MEKHFMDTYMAPCCQRKFFLPCNQTHSLLQTTQNWSKNFRSEAAVDVWLDSTCNWSICMLKNRRSKQYKSRSNSHNFSTPQLTDAEDNGWLDFFSSPLTTRLLYFSEEVRFLDSRRSRGYFSKACKICTLKILLPFSMAYLNAFFIKCTPDFTLVVRKHHSYLVLCTVEH